MLDSGSGREMEVLTLRFFFLGIKFLELRVVGLCGDTRSFLCLTKTELRMGIGNHGFGRYREGLAEAG